MSRALQNDAEVRIKGSSLPFLISGAERAQAHADIMLCTEASDLSTGKAPEFDARLASIVRRDPSLLLEPIPDRYPLPRTEPESWHNADAAWRNNSSWYGTWLKRVVALDALFLKTLQAAFESGVHPDDTTAWPNGALLASNEWVEDPVRLELALKHGASPVAPANSERQYLLRALRPVMTADSLGGGGRARAALRSVNLLLDAGLKIDESKHEATTGLSARLLSVLGRFVHLNESLREDHVFLDRAFATMTRLHQAGADIDRPSGHMLLPPVVAALRSNCLPSPASLSKWAVKQPISTSLESTARMAKLHPSWRKLGAPAASRMPQH
ncbi:hypothetical protein [Paucibacter soli]|uniref:hypothetical protein n=1 Tax=Paucibacter soli TaxID=3133433 RepID=UPI00309F3AB0